MAINLSIALIFVPAAYVSGVDVLSYWMCEAILARWWRIMMHCASVVPFTNLASLFFSLPGTVQALSR